MAVELLAAWAGRPWDCAGRSGRRASSSARGGARGPRGRRPSASLLAQGPGVDGAAQGARDLGEGLIAGGVDDDVVARREAGRGRGQRMASSAPACTRIDSGPEPVVEPREVGVTVFKKSSAAVLTICFKRASLRFSRLNCRVLFWLSILNPEADYPTNFLSGCFEPGAVPIGATVAEIGAKVCACRFLPALRRLPSPAWHSKSLRSIHRRAVRWLWHHLLPGGQNAGWTIEFSPIALYQPYPYKRDCRLARFNNGISP